MTNLGAHSIDIVQWFLDAKGPSSVYSTGGRLALRDGGETPLYRPLADLTERFVESEAGWRPSR